MKQEPKYLLKSNREQLDDEFSPDDYERKRQQAQFFGVARSLLILVGLIVLTVLFARRSRGPAIEGVTMADNLTSDAQPAATTVVYSPTDIFYASAETLGYEDDMQIAARWSYEGTTLATRPLDPGRVGERHLGFTFRPADAGRDEWLPGSYTVEILFEDRALAEAEFRVQDQ